MYAYVCRTLLCVLTWVNAIKSDLEINARQVSSRVVVVTVTFFCTRSSIRTIFIAKEAARSCFLRWQEVDFREKLSSGQLAERLPASWISDSFTEQIQDYNILSREWAWSKQMWAWLSWVLISGKTLIPPPCCYVCMQQSTPAACIPKHWSAQPSALS